MAKRREPSAFRIGAVIQETPRLFMSRKKKAVFAVMAVVIILGLSEVLLALFGVRPAYLVADPYVGFKGDSPLFEKTIEGGREVYQTVRSKVGLFNLQKFPVVKGANAYRVFSMGGSTTYGHPYDDRTSFSGWLRAFARVADPARDWQIINCGGVSYASYREAKLMEELIRYQPDLFIVHTGHNEFLERRTYAGIIDEPPVLTWVNRTVNRSRVAAVMHGAWRRIRPDERQAAKEQYLLTGEVKPLLDWAAGLDYYERDEPMRRQIIDHFRFNLGRMVALARSVGADVVFVQPPVNLRDFSPFKSQHRDGITPDALAEWQRHFDAGTAALEGGVYEQAAASFRRAQAIDDRYAQLHFLLGRALFALREYDAAKTAFEAALVEDVCPLRILPEMNTVIENTALQYRAQLIDLRTALELRLLRADGHTMLGDEDFLDHVHPTIEANQFLGRLLVDALAKRGVLRTSPSWGHDEANDVAARIEASLSPRDHAMADGTLAKVLRWAGKEDEADRLAMRSASVIPDDPNAVGELAAVYERQGRIDEAIELYERAISIDPGIGRRFVSVGWLLLGQGRLEDAGARFEQALRLDPADAGAHRGMGTTMMRQRQYERALQHYTAALRIDAAIPEIHVDIGIAHLNLGRHEEAIGKAQEEIRLNPRSSSARVLLAAVLRAVQRHEEELSVRKELVTIAPDNPEARIALGRCLLERGDAQAAVEQYEAAVRLRPGSPDAHFNLGVALVEMGNNENAQNHFEQTIALAPKNPLAYYRLGLLRRHRGAHADAVSVFRMGLAAAPDYVPLNQALAWTLATTPDVAVRDGAEAVQIALHACQLTRFADTRCLDALAAAYAEQGRFDDAFETLRKAIELANSAGHKDHAKELSGRLTSYEQRQPIRAR